MSLHFPILDYILFAINQSGAPSVHFLRNGLKGPEPMSLIQICVHFSIFNYLSAFASQLARFLHKIDLFAEGVALVVVLQFDLQYALL